jgi:L,D-peptidoglycan transpeptidase YkuD (ErfK/YbiS/YcfS/YnhG family)
MAYKRRSLVILLRAFLALILGVGTYGLWMHTALRDHPWQLEFWADTLAGNCRTAMGAPAFRLELATLATQLSDAKQCLADVQGTWIIRRDYTPCVEKLLHSSLIALRIRWNEDIRFQTQKTRLDAALKTLAREIEEDTSAKPGTVRNYSQFQARTLLDSARNLAALGQTESALVAVLRARAAWAQSETFIASELSRFYDDELRSLWEKQAQNLLNWTVKTRRPAILVDKLEHRCFYVNNGRVERSYVANLGRNWFRNKAQEQDASTPEGEYKVTQKFPSTAFGWALLLDYPNASDWKRFNAMKKDGQIANGARIGSGIEIHGGGRSNSDWTDGCVSLENAEMADLFRKAYVGMPVTIVGTSSVGDKH